MIESLRTWSDTVDLVSGDTPRTIAIYTVPTGQTLKIINAGLITVSQSGSGTGPTIELGNSTDATAYDNSLLAGEDYFSILPSFAPYGTPIIATITANSTYATHTGSVFIVGHLFPAGWPTIDFANSQIFASPVANQTLYRLVNANESVTILARCVNTDGTPFVPDQISSVTVTIADQDADTSTTLTPAVSDVVQSSLSLVNWSADRMGWNVGFTVIGSYFPTPDNSYLVSITLTPVSGNPQSVIAEITTRV